MSTYTEEVGKKLNELLERTYDAERGYKTAAENVKNAKLKGYFERKAQERYDFGHALKAEIKQFGQEVDKGDSLKGKAHRSWMDLKSLFSTGGEEAMLEEAITGEKAAVEEYDDILKEINLPASTESLLKQQREQIKVGLKDIKSLEDIT